MIICYINFTIFGNSKNKVQDLSLIPISEPMRPY